MNKHNYITLLKLSNQIDPMALNFPSRTINLLTNLFGFSKVTLAIFTENEPYYSNIPVSDQDDLYHKDVILLRNEQAKYIGLLSIFQYKDSRSSSSNHHDLIDEITKIVEKALQIHIRFYQLEVKYSLLQNMVAHLPTAVILCNSNFHIIHINQAAIKSLELFSKKVSLSEAESIIKNKLLPVYLRTGANEYSLSFHECHLQVSIHNNIIHEIGKGKYTTCYQITINCVGKMNETKWNEFLKHKELTNRECEVSNLLRLGFTNDEIAANLHISINTMKRHRESIYRKLNINRINQLNILYEENIKKYKQ